MAGGRDSSESIRGHVPPPPPQGGVPVQMDQVFQRLAGVLERQQAQLERQEQTQGQQQDQIAATRQLAEAVLKSAAGGHAPREDWSLASFRRLNPPTFTGVGSPLEAERWLVALRRLFAAEGYSDEDKLRFAVIQLSDDAVFGWDSEVRALEAAGAVASWKIFQDKFLELHFPSTVKAEMADDFKWIQQGSQSVLEYEQRFAGLSRYAPHLVHTDLDRARHFLQGLRPGIQEEVDKLMLSTYAETVTRAKHIEKIFRGIQERKNGQKRGASSLGPTSSGPQQPPKRQDSRPAQSAGSVQMSTAAPPGRFNGKCNNCGIFGHTAKYCSQPKKQSGSALAGTSAPPVPSASYSAARSPFCLNCKSPGHYTRECPSERRCYSCGRTGHLSSACTSSQQGSVATGSNAVARGGGQGGRPATQGRAFAITEEEAYAAGGMVAGVLYGQTTAVLSKESYMSKGSTFRHMLYPSYKSNRIPTPDTVVQGLQYLKASIKAMSIKVIEVPGVEADDVIGTLAVNSVSAGFKVRIVSPDKDFFQVLSPSLRLLRIAPRGPGMISFGLEDFAKRYGQLQPSQFVDVVALAGDNSDNIPGVEGIGEINSIKLITKFGSVENLLQCVDQIEEERFKKALTSNADQALLCKNLATLRSDLPPYMVPFTMPNLVFQKPEDNGEKFICLLRAIGAYAEGFSADPIIRRASYIWNKLPQRNFD